MEEEEKEEKEKDKKEEKRKRRRNFSMQNTLKSREKRRSDSTFS
jgi:hypothetical protein